MATLVLAEDVPAAAQLLPHVGHLLAKGGILPLQEGGSHRNLVLLEPPGVPRALGRLVVLGAPVPVLLILLSVEGRKVGKERQKEERNEKGQWCDDEGRDGGKEEGRQQISSR